MSSKSTNASADLVITRLPFENTLTSGRPIEMGAPGVATERITIFVESLETGGFLVESDDLPQLNIIVAEEANLASAVSGAIEYLYKNNKHVDVNVTRNVILEPPVTGDPTQ